MHLFISETRWSLPTLVAVVVRVSMLRSSYRARQQVDAGVYTGEEKLLYIYIWYKMVMRKVANVFVAVHNSAYYS